MTFYTQNQHGNQVTGGFESEYFGKETIRQALMLGRSLLPHLIFTQNQDPFFIE
jgi:hypothetical protein